MGRLSVLLAFMLPGLLMAQSADSTPAVVSGAPTALAEGAVTTDTPTSDADEKGLLSHIDFSGNTNSLGHMLAFDFGLGYQFNQHVTIDGQVPFYYVSASTTTTDSTGASTSTTTTDQGIGDPSFALHLRFPNRILEYRTRFTTWIPVADINSGFTTGSALVDWTSHLSRPVGRLLPFGQVGLANTVPDTPLFFLPYTAQGFNARFETGAQAVLSTILSTGASFYYVLPSGNQTLYSREVHGSGAGAGSGGAGGGTGGSGGSAGGTGGSDNGQGGGQGGGNGSGNGNVAGAILPLAMGAGGSGNGNRNGFMTQQVTEGNDLTRDHGFSAWITASLPHFVDLEIGLTRSVGYDLNTVSFGVGFDPIRAIGRRSK